MFSFQRSIFFLRRLTHLLYYTKFHSFCQEFDIYIFSFFFQEFLNISLKKAYRVYQILHFLSTHIHFFIFIAQKRGYLNHPYPLFILFILIILLRR